MKFLSKSAKTKKNVFFFFGGGGGGGGGGGEGVVNVFDNLTKNPNLKTNKEKKIGWGWV